MLAKCQANRHLSYEMLFNLELSSIKTFSLLLTGNGTVKSTHVRECFILSMRICYLFHTAKLPF